MQLRELREYAALRSWEIVGECTDQGVSGSRESRPQLNRLMSDAQQRKFDAVLVWKRLRLIAKLLGIGYGTVRARLEPSGIPPRFSSV
jgi:hypothetical protein